MFERSAAEYKNVAYGHLATQANKYRGKIITVSGKMASLRETRRRRSCSRRSAGVLQRLDRQPDPGAPPFAVLFTELPKDVMPNEEFNRKVTFQGYFIAHVLFPAAKGSGQKDVVAPYLVGKTITLNDKAPPAAPKKDDSPSNAYNIVLIAVGAVTIVLVFFIIVNIWLRRADNRTQAQAAGARAPGATFELEADEPEEVNHGEHGEHGEMQETRWTTSTAGPMMSVLPPPYFPVVPVLPVVQQELSCVAAVFV